MTSKTLTDRTPGMLAAFLATALLTATAAAQENTAEACRDAEDNDDDGAIDCADTECGDFTFCVETPTVPGLPLPGLTSRRAEPLDSVLVILSLGGTFSRYGGAGLTLGLAGGGSGAYVYLAGRIHGGAQFKDGDPWLQAGAELGFRGIFRLPAGVAPHFTITAGYAFDRQKDTRTIESYTPQGDLFLWHSAYGRIGGGVLFGRRARVNNGFEINAAAGYSFHANADENPWGENYNRVFWQVELRYLATF